MYNSVYPTQHDLNGFKRSPWNVFFVSEVCGHKGKLENRDCLSLVNYGIFKDIAKEVYSHGVIAGPEGLNEDYQYNLI